MVYRRSETSSAKCKSWQRKGENSTIRGTLTVAKLAAGCGDGRDTQKKKTSRSKSSCQLQCKQSLDLSSVLTPTKRSNNGQTLRTTAAGGLLPAASLPRDNELDSKGGLFSMRRATDKTLFKPKTNLVGFLTREECQSRRHNLALAPAPQPQPRQTSSWPAAAASLFRSARWIQDTKRVRTKMCFSKTARAAIGGVSIVRVCIVGCSPFLDAERFRECQDKDKTDEKSRNIRTHPYFVPAHVLRCGSHSTKGGQVAENARRSTSSPSTPKKCSANIS